MATEKKLIGTIPIQTILDQGNQAVNQINNDASVLFNNITKETNDIINNLDTSINELINNIEETADDTIQQIKQTAGVLMDSFEIINDDNEERTEITLDSSNKIVSYRKIDGVKVECAGIESPTIKTDDLILSEDYKKAFASDIKNNLNMPYMTKKFNIPDYGSVDIICEILYMGTDGNPYNPKQVTKVNDIYYVTDTLLPIYDPYTGKIVRYDVLETSISTAYTEIDVDLNDREKWPQTKDKHYCKVKLKFGDIDGTWYATVAFQGASTLAKLKKGLRIVLYKKSDFDKKDKIKIGEIVETSKFNVKAYYDDPTRLRDVFLQRIIVEARYLREYKDQFPWNSDYPMNTGAVGTIQSFPVKLTMSGNFYGVSMFGLAKDEKNFMLDGDETGMIISGDWAGDGPSFAEFNPYSWSDEMNDDELLIDHGHTPSNYAALTSFWDWINNTEWTKNNVADRMSIIDWIDYYIFIQVFYLRDNDVHNIILYTKQDKYKFYAFLYDLDLSLGKGGKTPLNIDNPKLILWKKFVNLYWDEIIDRYNYLRQTVLNYNHIISVLSSLQASIKYSDFVDEMTTWNEINYKNATESMISFLKTSLEYFDDFFKK